jgi:hypothetical protein
LDNSNQIAKLSRAFNDFMNVKNPRLKSFLLIHDEADVITKDYDVDLPSDGQCESHKKWLLFVNNRDFRDKNILKRVFVTATPENIVYKYNIDSFVKLDVPDNYVGYDKINYKAVDFDEINVTDLILTEQNRLIQQKQNGVIILASERRIQNGQDLLFEEVCAAVDCVVNTYNGNGIIARVNNPDFEHALDKFIEERIPDSKIVAFQERPNVWNLQKMAICDFYEICRLIGSGVIVTIGMDLVARGISFVSSSRKFNAIAATTVIYRPGETRHAVAITQALGRITGTARPDLPRYVYSTEKIINDYKSFNQNQEQYVQAILDNNGEMTPELMTSIELKYKIFRNLDRAHLRLNPTYKADMIDIQRHVQAESSDEDSSDDDDYTDDDTTVDGVEKRKLKIWLRNSTTTTIGKMVKFLYKNGNVNDEISFEEFKQKIDYDKSDEHFRNNLQNGCSYRTQYGKLWTTGNNFQTIEKNPNIQEYIESLY